MMVSRIENIYQLNDRGTMKIYSLGEETINSIVEEDKKLSEQVQIIDDYIVINVAYEYNILLSTCSTHQQILNWVWHLTEKTWMTQNVTRRFIEVACGYHKLDYRQ